MSNCVINSLRERLVGITSQAIWVTCMGSCSVSNKANGMARVAGEGCFKKKKKKISQ